MSAKRRFKREVERTRYQQVLANLLGDFYDFLSQENKPSDEHVREAFEAQQNRWFVFCSQHSCLESKSNSFRDLFAINVKKTWEHKLKKA